MGSKFLREMERKINLSHRKNNTLCTENELYSNFSCKIIHQTCTLCRNTEPQLSSTVKYFPSLNVFHSHSITSLTLINYILLMPASLSGNNEFKVTYLLFILSQWLPYPNKTGHTITTGPSEAPRNSSLRDVAHPSFLTAGAGGPPQHRGARPPRQPPHGAGKRLSASTLPRGTTVSQKQQHSDRGALPPHRAGADNVAEAAPRARRHRS